MTPVNFPLVHNELPFGLGKSYSDAVTLGYHRLKGMRQVEPATSWCSTSLPATP